MASASSGRTTDAKGLDLSSKCLSEHQHDIGDIGDFQRHFFGCIPMGDRINFLTYKDPWDKAARLEDKQDQISAEPGSRRSTFEITPDETVRRLRYTTAILLEAEFKRIEILRNAVSRDPELQNLVANVERSREQWRGSPECRAYIKEVRKWRNRVPRSAPFQGPKLDKEDSSESPGAQLAVDIHAVRKKLRKIVRDFRSARTPGVNTRHDDDDDDETEERGEGEKDKISAYCLESDIKAQFIKLERTTIQLNSADGIVGVMNPGNESEHYDIFKGRFPNQHLALAKLLASEFGGQFARRSMHLPLRAPGEPTADSAPDQEAEMPWPDSRDNPCEVRYYHIPSNNMKWVEDALEHYFQGDVKTWRQVKQVLLGTYWKGQQHGSGPDHIVHLRHLRSLCETFSTDPELSHISSHDNMVLFMPYLHWETDRRRGMMADVIERLMDNEELKERRAQWAGKARRIQERAPQGVQKLPLSSLPKLRHPTGLKNCGPDSSIARHRTIEDMIWERARREMLEEVDTEGEPDRTTTERTSREAPALPASGRASGHAPPPETKKADRKVRMKKSHNFWGFPMDQRGRLTPPHPLAQYLIDAARLHEAMSTYRDRQLLTKYLFSDSPLHPRRTLDQSYFWKLRTTRRRDKDQVVFRFTRADLLHKLRPTQDEKTLRKAQAGHAAATSPAAQGERVLQGWEWTDHTASEDKNGCQECHTDIRKLSRAIMVDQLWMWILDKDTILTCFPPRYGVGKEDPSGVHQAIRKRLKDQSSPLNYVCSVFDLGLIILDECFDVMFNRTRTADARPQVLDIFAESIGKVANSRTILMKHLWQLTNALSLYYRSPIYDSIPDRLVIPLLNITTEGLLQQEIRDIIDELDIIIHIVKQQQEVISNFIENSRDILESESDGTKKPNDSDPQPVPEIRFKSDGTWSIIDQRKPRAPRKASEARDPASHEHGTEPEGEKCQGQLDKTDDERDRQQQECQRQQQEREFLSKVQEQQQKSFEKRSGLLQTKVTDRVKELEGLKASAESAAAAVDDLITLKQQQASVVQAYQAMRQGEETVRQGRAIMLFTVMTIIFLPLSFMTSLFGMNAVELTGSNSASGGPTSGSSSDVSSTAPSGLLPGQIANFWPVTFARQLAIMFPISFATIMVALLLAFSPPVRAILYSYLWYGITWLQVRSRLYKYWVSHDIHIDEDDAIHIDRDRVKKRKLRAWKMKHEVRKEWYESRLRTVEREAQDTEEASTGRPEPPRNGEALMHSSNGATTSVEVGSVEPTRMLGHRSQPPRGKFGNDFMC